MDTLRDLTGLQQALLLTFRAPARDLARTMEDIRAVAPTARYEPSDGGDVVDVALQLPDGAAMLEQVTPIIFRVQGRLGPALSVRRVLASFGEQPARRALRPAASRALAQAAAA